MSLSRRKDRDAGVIMLQAAVFETLYRVSQMQSFCCLDIEQSIGFLSKERDLCIRVDA